MRQMEELTLREELELRRLRRDQQFSDSIRAASTTHVHEADQTFRVLLEGGIPAPLRIMLCKCKTYFFDSAQAKHDPRDVYLGDTK